MKRLVMALAVLPILATSTAADAQDRWAFEIRASGAIPSRQVGNDFPDTGFGFEATVRYRLLPHTAAYAGWDWTRFRADPSFAGAAMDLEETGYAFGIRFEHALHALPGLAGWVRGGGTYNHVEVEDDSGATIADSGHGLGWEVGAGVAMAVGRGWSLTPGVRFRSLSREIDVAGASVPLNLEYVALEIGITHRF